MVLQFVWKRSSRKELQNKLASVVKIVNFGINIVENEDFCNRDQPNKISYYLQVSDEVVNQKQAVKPHLFRNKCILMN